MHTLGVIIRLDHDKRFGVVLTAQNDRLPFLFSEFKSPLEQLQDRASVSYDVAPHPYQSDRNVAKNVRSVRLEPADGVVVVQQTSYGFIRLDDGRSVYFNRHTCSLDLSVGTPVRCAYAVQPDGRLFALSVDLNQRKEAHEKTSQGPEIALSSRKGSHVNKSFNDDSFLITDMANGSMWLLAVADGVSNPPNGWWASNKCMELLWRSRTKYEGRLMAGLGGESDQEIIHDWMNEVHREFLRSRRVAPPEFQQCTSTLTFVVAKGRNIAYAHCGDTRLYRLSGKGEFVGLISDRLESQRAKGRDGRLGLVNHIASASRDWDLGTVVNSFTLERSAVLILCSDGVISSDEKREKRELLRSLRSSEAPLQEQAEQITNKITQMGERDDLTLIAFRPEDR